MPCAESSGIVIARWFSASRLSTGFVGRLKSAAVSCWPRHDVVDRDLAAQGGGIRDGAILDLVALEAGRLEHALLGDQSPEPPLGREVTGD